MSEQRGLVISPPIRIDGDILLMESAALDAQELRAYLLFWDKLDWPSNNIINIGSGPDEQYLENAGVLTRTRVLVQASGDMAQWYRDAHIAGYRALDAKEPGSWSLARGAKSISFTGDDLEIGRGILVRLHDAVPVPNKDVPLEEILSFKSKRNDELVEFRSHLDKLYQKILSQPDSQLAMLTEKINLERSLSNYIKTARESKWPFRLTTEFNAKIKLSTADIPKALVCGTLVGGFTSSTPIGVAAGLMSLLEFTLDVGLKGQSSPSGPKSRDCPFEYIAAYHRDVFI